jgi:HTH-type transcriptional regulator/antitoxin HipB
MLIKSARELSHFIRDRRHRLLLTQAQLARAVGVSRKWIIDLEAGKPAADLSLVLRTLRALGVELDARERAKASSKNEEIDLDAIINSAGGPKR